MNLFTIKDLENLSGIKAHTIRVWEQRYSFLKPQRTETNIRCYSNQELKMILNISLLHKYGFKISHINKMTEQEIKEKIFGLSHAQAQQERIVNELIQHMIEMDVDQFEQVLDNYIVSRGIDKTILQIIFPFLERIGILWTTNHVNPSQEHLVSNVIRQKLIVGIEGSVTHMFSNKTILLFLPEGEHHEVGLLYMHYLLKNRGMRIIYLGANVPVKDLGYVCKYKHPDYIYTHLTCIAGNFNFEKFITQASLQINGIPMAVSGKLAQGYSKKTPPNIHLKRSLAEVTEFVGSL